MYLIGAAINIKQCTENDKELGDTVICTLRGDFIAILATDWRIVH